MNREEMLKANSVRPRMGNMPSSDLNTTVGLQQLLASLPHIGLAIEVGSNKGVSTECLCLFCDHVISVDNGKVSEPTGLKDLAELMRNGKISAIRMDSTEAAKIMACSIADLVYLDALHDYQSVKNDILAWKNKLKPGMFMSGHDYSPDVDAGGVSRAVNELLGMPKIFPDTSWLFQIP